MALVILCIIHSACTPTHAQDDRALKNQRAAEIAGTTPSPVLVLLPGLDGTGKLFAEFVKVLDPGVGAIVLAFPPDQPLGYDELHAVVMGVLDKLPRDQRFVLLGESFSGPLAIRIAARAPPGLCGLILSASFAANPFPWLAWARPLAAYLPVKSLPRWLRAPLMWGSLSPDRAPSQMERAMSGVSAAVVRRRIAALLAVDETSALERVAVPTLLLRARGDRVIPKGATRRILKTLPQAELVEIDGPHLLLQTRPRECAAAVLRFLERALKR
jgi:pimeloyl-[acyl-carrier protein] methyl ester esterase